MRLPARVEPLAYAVHLQIDPAQAPYSGEVQIDLRLKPVTDNQPPPNTLRLHAKDLNLRAAWLEVGARRWVAKVQRVDAERVDLRFAQALPLGAARLGLAFAGQLQDKDVYGVFRQRTSPEPGSPWMVATQFEPTGGRLAFPMFDEPGWKVPWTLSLTVPDTLQAVANTAVQQTEAAGPGQKRVSFLPTPPLPSYLLAFAVGEFDTVAGPPTASQVPVQIIVPKGRAAEAAYAAQVTGPIVDKLEAYFGSPYPYAKLDQLSVPVTVDFGAMEHPGLVTYASGLLLATPAEQTPAFERNYVSTAAHELAHQWFGNLVTMAWWDDLWLNESFASWMGDRITAQLMPQWGWETATALARSKAMQADRLVSARQIVQPVNVDDDMGNLWDAITYEKGQSVLSMFERWMGPQAFKAGVRRYMQRHAWVHATGADFFAALAVDAPGLPDAVRSFTHQSGIPVVDVRLRCDDGPPALLLSQSRLLPLGSVATRDSARQWQIPVRVRTPGGQAQLLLDQPQATLPLPDAQCPAWVQANADGVGYYRVAYADDLLGQLSTSPDQSASEILALLDDAKGLHAAGRLGNAQLLALVATYAHHPRQEVVQAVVGLLDHLRPLADGQPQMMVSAWQSALGARARQLGWLPKASDSPADRLLRPTLVPAMAQWGQDEALRNQAQAMAAGWLQDRSSVPAALRAAVLQTAAATSDDEHAGPLFDALLAALRTSTERPERSDLLAALGRFQPPVLARRALGLLLDAGIDVRDSLDPLLDGQALTTSGRAVALDFVSRNFKALTARLGRDDPAWLPSHFKAGCSADEARQLERVFSPQAARYQGGPLQLRRALEAVHLCTAWREAQAGRW
jgi:alanyl aminopeptidase